MAASGPEAAAGLTALLHQAVALHRGGRLREASALYDRILRAVPGHPEILHLQGLVALQGGRPGEALALIDRALRAAPGMAAAHGNRGAALRALKRHAEALASYDRAIALQPGDAEAHSNRGSVLSDLGRWQEALESFDRALALRPGAAEIHSNRGNALRALGRWQDAIAAYDAAIAIDLAYAGAHNNRGNALLALRRWEEALASYEEAIRLRPDFPEALTNRGNALSALRREEEALASHDRAIALRPDFAEAHSNRGQALVELGRWEEAVAACDRAIALDPGLADAHNGRGNALRELRRWPEAAASFDRAIALRPDYAEAYWNKSFGLLLNGGFEEGWRLYEWRKRKRDAIANRFEGRPTLTGGEDVAGRTVFVWWEQGLGDTIQFARYALTLRDRGARVVLSVQEPLTALYRQLEPGVTVIGSQEAPTTCDWQVPVMSLPLACGPRREDIPYREGHLRADPALREAWARRLGPRRRPRIGLAWRGNPANRHDPVRSIPPERLAPLLAMDADWVYVQNDIRPADADFARTATGIRFFCEELRSFADTAALIEALDMVVSIDTSLAHLSGTLGRPTWVMLSAAADWRWGLSGEECAWYATARLFRQPRLGDWDGVVARVREALVACFPEHLSG